MRLKQIHIPSFKSIVNQTIDVTEKCIGLVGLNESGKTNALSAIRMLSEDYDSSSKDRSKIDSNLPHVEFVFDFKNDEELEQGFIENLYEERTVAGWDEVVDISTLKISEFKIIQELDSDETIKTSYSHLFSFQPKNLNQYGYLKKGCGVPAGEIIEINGKNWKISEGMIVEKSSASEVTKEYLTDLTKEIVFQKLHNDISKILQTYDYIPSIVYWEHSKEYLLPSEISYSTLLAENKPKKVSRPLFNIFLISEGLNMKNEKDLIERVTLWQQDSSQRKKDSSKINESINSYMKNVWKDYDQDIELTLESSGITIHILDPNSPDKNYYEMSERSQGFKTFASFLLTIAAESHVGELDNFILVLDEPETHLHPSGVRFMMKELLKLCEKNNNVFYATHSVFMIDRANLNRHLIIEKQLEKTIVKSIDRQSLINENVIYEALGTNIDEFSMKLKNVIFEGVLDRNLFSFYLEQCLPKKDNPFGDYGLLDGCGTGKIGKYFKGKILPEGSVWRLILDNDKPAKSLEKTMFKDFDGEIGKSVFLNNYSEEKDFILEDLFPAEIINESLDVISRKYFSKLEKITYDEGRSVNNTFFDYTKENSIDFDRSNSIFLEFKEISESKINEILKEVKKVNTIDSRSALFKERLPKYSNFIDGYIKEIKG